MSHLRPVYGRIITFTIVYVSVNDHIRSFTIVVIADLGTFLLLFSIVLFEQFVVHHILVYLLLFPVVIFGLFFFLMHHDIMEVDFRKTVFHQQCWMPSM